MGLFKKKTSDEVADLLVTIAKQNDLIADLKDDIRCKDNTIEALRKINAKAENRNGKLQYKLDFLKQYVEDHGLEVPKEALNLKQLRNEKDNR